MISFVVLSRLVGFSRAKIDIYKAGWASDARILRGDPALEVLGDALAALG